MIGKVYLGDSVYIDIENGMFKLTTENGYPDDPRNVIYLDLSVYRALLSYVDAVIGRSAQQHALERRKQILRSAALRLRTGATPEYVEARLRTELGEAAEE